ncbi:MAG: hypothetical protein KF878_04470 [Planctomycetes bacterium]|nr:hypothetical protein [Planctomycetota bacterium]
MAEKDGLEADVRDPCDETGPIPALPHGDLDRDDDLRDSGEGEVEEPDEDELGVAAEELVAELEGAPAAGDPVEADAGARARALAAEVQPAPAGNTARVDLLAETADPDQGPAATARVRRRPRPRGRLARRDRARAPPLDDEPPPPPPAARRPAAPPCWARAATAAGALVPFAGVALVALAGAPQALLQRWSGHDRFEPNDRLERSAPLPLGTTEGASCGPTDVDWFSLEVPAGMALVVEVVSPGGRGGASLHAPDGRRLTAAAWRRDRHRLVSPVAGATPGAVHLCVWGPRGPYEVQARAVDPAARLEPNGAPSDAAPVAAGLTAGVRCDGEDWLRVRVPAHHRARARLASAAPGLVVAWGHGPGEAEAVAPPVALEREALLRVSGGVGAYDLEVTLEPERAADPDDGAPHLAPGDYAGVSLGGRGTWRLVLPAGHALEVEAEGPDRWAPHLVLMDEAGRQVDGADLSYVGRGAVSRLTYEVAEATTALLQVSGGAGDYALSIALHPRAATPAAPAPVSRAAGASALLPGESRQEVWSEEWFVVEVEAGQVVSVRAEVADPTGADLRVALHDAAGAALPSVEVAQGVHEVEHVAATSGPLQLSLATRDAYVACKLRLAIDGVAGPRVLAPGRHEALRCRGEALFRVDAPGGRRLLVELRFRSADGDLDVELLDAEGHVVAASESLDDVERVSYVAPADEALTLRVHNAANRFDVEVRVEEP